MPRLSRARREHAHEYLGESDPLISVTIPTWNRGEVLAERTLPAILNQTYRNFEIVVVGDHCTDDTEKRIQAIDDPRIVFANLDRRGAYPRDPTARWRVAGTAAINKALDLASGDWLAYSDDDDILLPHHLETLLRFATQGEYELVYGMSHREVSPELWREWGDAPLGHSRTPHSAVLYRSYLRLFRYNINAHHYNLPVDADLWERMYRAGVRFGFIPRVVSLQPLPPRRGRA